MKTSQTHLLPQINRSSHGRSDFPPPQLLLQPEIRDPKPELRSSSADPPGRNPIGAAPRPGIPFFPDGHDSGPPPPDLDPTLSPPPPPSLDFVAGLHLSVADHIHHLRPGGSQPPSHPTSSPSPVRPKASTISPISLCILSGRARPTSDRLLANPRTYVVSCTAFA